MATVTIPREIEGRFTIPEGETAVVEDIVDIFPGPGNDAQCGSVENRGVLSIPEDAGLIRFNKIDESKFVGGDADDVVDSDPGIWTLGNGRLDWPSADNRERWMRGQCPTWKTTDDVILGPHIPGDTTTFDPFRVNVDAVPMLPDDRGATMFKRTDDIKVMGEEGGRPHIFVRSTQPQRIEGGLIDVGPDAFGRYGIHFHLCGEGSRGSIVKVYLEGFGSNGIVTHGSNGVLHENCAVYDPALEVNLNTDHTPVTWDTGVQNASHDNLFNRILIAGTNGSHRHAAMQLKHGTGNAVTNSWAVGVNGKRSAGAWWWGEGGSGTWLFRGNGDNNCIGSTKSWQNNSELHVIEGHTSIFAVRGIDDGAYLNNYQWKDYRVFGAEVGIRQHANSGGGQLLRLGGREDGYGKAYERVITEHCDVGLASGSAPHRLTEGGPTLYLECEFNNSRTIPILLEQKADTGPDDKRKRAPRTHHFVRCSVDGRNLELSDIDMIGMTHPGSSAWIENEDDAPAWMVGPDGVVQTVDPFYSLRAPAEGNFAMPTPEQKTEFVGSSIDFAEPVQAGSVLLALYTNTRVDVVEDAPPGWEPSGSIREQSTIAAYTKVADGSEERVNFGVDGDLYLAEFTGVDIEDPTDVNASASQGKALAGGVGVQTSSVKRPNALAINVGAISRFDFDEFTGDVQGRHNGGRQKTSSIWSTQLLPDGGIAELTATWLGTTRGAILITVLNPKEEALPVPVHAAFDVTPRQGEAPLSVTITDNSTGPITGRVHDWDDGSSGPEREHIYTEPDDYEIVLTVTGDDGQVDATSKFVTVTEKPVDPPVDPPVIENLEVHAKFLPGGAIEGTWSDGS